MRAPLYLTGTRKIDIITIIVTIAAFVFLASHIVFAADNSAATAFVQKATVGGAFEVQTSKVALMRSRNSDIQAFAQTMIDDHSALGNKLDASLKKTSVSPGDIKTGLDADHEAKLEKLKSASDRDFDQVYIKDQRDAHDEAVQLFSSYSKTGSDPILKSFATEALPELQHHQQLAQNLTASSSTPAQAPAQ